MASTSSFNSNVSGPSDGQGDVAQMLNKYILCINSLLTEDTKDNSKVQTLQEISDNLDIILTSPQYHSFLELCINVFIKYLSQGQPQFTSENHIQRTRKVMLELISRFPFNEYIKTQVESLLKLCLDLLERENEENALLAIRIFFKLHKHCRPPLHTEAPRFIKYTQVAYNSLAKNMGRVFDTESKLQRHYKDFAEIHVEHIVNEIHALTPITVETREPEGKVTVKIFPRGCQSLKTAQELPIIVVFIYQLYQEHVRKNIEEFIPIILNTINLCPPIQFSTASEAHKESFIDLLAAQIKGLSFLAYVVGVYRETLAPRAQQLVDGILNLFVLCPSEITKLRKELLIATRQILQTDFREKFVPRMKILLDESVVLGAGWTTQEALRPLVYSTLAELLRPTLPLLDPSDLRLALHLFARTLHDETLPPALHTLCCKLLLSMVDAARGHAPAAAEDMLLRLLETLVLKLKTIARRQLPVLQRKTQSPPAAAGKGPSPPAALYNMAECKALVKVLVQGVERTTLALASVRPSGGKYQPQDTRFYIRLLKWGLQALDVYALLSPQPGIRTMEEKETLETFAAIFLHLAPQSFREVFCHQVEYMIERVSKNYNLQLIGSVFVSKDTSPIFATLLVEYLLEHMAEMGEENKERSDLFLKLFKMVFESVSTFAENEHMLRPHVHSIVNKSMELAMTAKKPFNYFLLLKVLFLSIGNGKHDLLYQEFLPLLRNLFQGLNNLQAGRHKQQMRDLFVELCLKVPVRLSSLLPYLPMLMDPLVSALNGSPALVSQGLRILELFVGNLQPDFLYDHIQPVRAELMQALWRSLRNPNEQVALVAFRVLGKFGGANRKMIEPQKLEFSAGRRKSQAFVLQFPDHHQNLNVGLEKVLETAVVILKSSSIDMFYRKQAWEVLKSYILASMNVSGDLHLTLQSLAELTSKEPADVSELFQKYPNTHLRSVHQEALVGMFLAYGVKEIRTDVLHFSVVVVRQYTLVAIAQHFSPLLADDKSAALENTMDPQVLIDALTVMFAHENKEFCKPGYLALKCIFNTATSVCGSSEIACSLPFIEYLVEQMCSLCYETAWFTKLGGCYAIQFLYNTLSTAWLLTHMYATVRALLFVIMDLTGDVSSGTLDIVKQSLTDIIIKCATPVDPKTQPLQTKALLQVGDELVRNIASSNTWLREQSVALLETLAKTQGKTVNDIMELHRDIVQINIPPKQLNITDYSANAQIGIMEANTFCQSLSPRFFTLDVHDPDHKTFFQHVFSICESSDQALIKMPCYKSVDSLVPLRKSAMRALASWHYIPAVSQKIFNVLYAALDKPNPELQTAGFQAMKTFVTGSPIDRNTMYDVTKPFLLTLGDYRNFDLKGVRKLSYIVQSFPSIFNEKLCEQLLVNLKNLFEDSATHQSSAGREDREKIIVIIMEIFEESPAAKPQFIDSLVGLVLQHEKALALGYSPYRAPLVKYLLRYPTETLQSLLNETHMKDPQWRLFLVFLIKHPNGKSFRECLQTQFTGTLIVYTSAALNVNANSTLTFAEKLELQYISIRIISILIKLDDQWLSSQTQLVSVVQKIWRDSKYLECHTRVENVSVIHWKEPKLLVKILLHYFSYHPNIIDLLFFILKAVTEKLLPDFTFLREFLDVTVAQSYTVDWKRDAFIRFVELFSNASMSQELKAKILQLVMLPCFTVCFERGEGDKLIAGTKEGQKNLATLFISQVVEAWKPSNLSDSLRILVMQMSCLLVDQAYHHIYDASKGNNIVKPFIIFAWPSFLTKNFVDPVTQYYGHLLLSHVIAKFAEQTCKVSKRTVVQVFISLLKAHANEVSAVVRQALEILTPAFPERVDNGYRMLAFWTKKIIIEEGHSQSQLFHLLTLIVKQYKVYYPVRHGLIQHMVTAMQRMGMSSAIDHKKLSVELADVIIKWELERIKNEAESTCDEPASKKLALAGLNSSGETSAQPLQEDLSITAAKPIDKAHVDAVINFLCQLSCPTIELPPNLSNTVHTQVLQSLGEGLSKRCVALVKVPQLWPRQNLDLRLAWLDKLLCNVEEPNVNLNNVATGFELLVFFIEVLDHAQILLLMKPLQKGLFTCLKCHNAAVVTHTRSFLTSLMGKFPIEYAPGASHSREEVDILYAYLSQTIIDSLSNYEKSSTLNSSLLYGPILFLKVACSNYVKYIDRFLDLLIRVLHKMAEEHTKNVSEATGQHDAELLSTGLDLVKNRLGSLGKDSRSLLLEQTVLELISKTPDVNVMRTVLNMTDKWLRGKDTELENAPSLSEKCLILVKLMHHVNRFPELNAQFLELTLFIYLDSRLKNFKSLVSKLKPAFLSGLLSSNPELRSKFFQLLNDSIRMFLYDRLMYIFNSQNWEPMGCSSWLRQCIELLLVSAMPRPDIPLADQSAVLPSVTSLVKTRGEREVKSDKLPSAVQVTDKLVETFEAINQANEKAEIAAFLSLGSDALDLESLLARQRSALDAASRGSTSELLRGVCNLCHLDAGLAEQVWVDVFPQLWRLLNPYQQQTLAAAILPFAVSGVHVNQKQEHVCPMGAVYEAFALCLPSLPLSPVIMTHMAKSHALWHRVTLCFESLAADTLQLSVDTPRPRPPDQQELMSHLADMYASLKEEDLWIGLWQKTAKYKETVEALSYEQQGLFEEALSSYKSAIVKGREEYCVDHTTPVNDDPEMLLWEQQLVRCCKELNQWKTLQEYGKCSSSVDPFLILDTAWKVPPYEWKLMRQTLERVSCSEVPKELQWKVCLYSGYLGICHPGEQPVSCGDHVEAASSHCIRLWRSYPRVVSHIHLPLLQAAQQIIELQEAAQFYQAAPNALSDMNATVKTWRTRLPVIADSLGHWSDVFLWRQHHYQFITSHFDALKYAGGNAGNRSILGVHSSAQAIIQFGKVARKHNLTSVCLESLCKLYHIPSVPIVDCFEKIRQQVKCYVQMATADGKDQLQEGLEVIEHTNLTYLTKEMTAEFYALKGMLLAQIGRSNEANKAFCQAVETHDVLVKAWALWGDYMEAQFTSSTPLSTPLGVAAITCFLHACRHQNEPKSRKYLAKVFWLLTFDSGKGGDAHGPTLMDALDMYSVGMPPIQWLSWIPQLLTCLSMSHGAPVKDLLTQVSRVYPQAVYLPIRTMYNTLKIEQRARLKISEQNGKPPDSGNSLNSHQLPSPGSLEGGKQDGDALRDTPAMRRCLSIMQTQREIDPPVMIALKTIVDQMSWFRESWHEQVLTQVRMALAKCHGLAFEKRDQGRGASITVHTFNFLTKLISTFGIGVESATSEKTRATSAGSESLAKRALQSMQDPAFQRMKQQFSRDFEFRAPGARKLHHLIATLRKWEKILEAKNRRAPRCFLLEENCRYLSNFTLQTAEIELPGEHLAPRHCHAYVCIARFLPRVHIVEKHHRAARRLSIRGHNGRVYPYLVMSDAGLIDSGRREERLLQLLRMLNHYLAKQKETAKRGLHFTVPRVVPVSAEFRLVEDNPSSLSLRDIYASGVPDAEAPVRRYYEAAPQPPLRELYEDIQRRLVPKDLLAGWAAATFHSATDYWSFRQRTALQLALACFAQYVFHLSRLAPDMMYLHQDTGRLNVSYFKFDLDAAGRLGGHQPVPFRLTPNLAHFLTGLGVEGGVRASVVAAARCLAQPNYQVAALLKAILRDEMIACQRKGGEEEEGGEVTISMVTHAVAAIRARLDIAGQDDKVSDLLRVAQCPDQLSRMDPCWMPWL